VFVPDTVHHGPANEQGHEVAGASPEGRDLVSGVILSEAIAQHPRRGRISLLRNPESGLNPASDRHPEAGTIAEGSRPCLRLSSPANAIAQHPRRGGISTLPLLVIPSERDRGASPEGRDLGVESGPNYKRDPSAMEPPSGFLSKIKPERGQECHDHAEVFLRMWIHNYKPCIAFFRETPNFPKIVRAVGENEIPCKSYLLNFLKGLSIGGCF